MAGQSPKTRPLAISDFKPQPGVMVADMPAVIRLAGKLAESATLVLSELDGTPIRATLDRIEDTSAAIMEETGAWFRVESRHGSMTVHLAFDRTAVSALCETAMGGAGTEAPYDLPDRPLSRIEKGLLRRALSKLETGVTATLAELLATPVRQFDGSVETTALEPQGGHVIFHFLVNAFSYSGELRLTASKAEIQVQLGEAAGGLEDALARDSQRFELQRRIGSAVISFSVALGPEIALVEDIASLAPGRLLRLSATAASPVIVSSAGNPVFAASLAHSGERLAVRIIAPLD
jgi:flagellar motor switch protein FliM